MDKKRRPIKKRILQFISAFSFFITILIIVAAGAIAFLYENTTFKNLLDIISRYLIVEIYFIILLIFATILFASAKHGMNNLTPQVGMILFITIYLLCENKIYGYAFGTIFKDDQFARIAGRMLVELAVFIRLTFVNNTEAFGIKHFQKKFNLWNINKQSRTERQGPPAKAMIILCFVLPSKDVQEVLGDLEEIYNLVLAKSGYKTANRCYWWHTIRSVGAFIYLKVVSFFALIGKIKGIIK